jgi:hypothetical protein
MQTPVQTIESTAGKGEGVHPSNPSRYPTSRLGSLGK